MQDQQAMALAIELAQQGLYSTSPNPRVGCVMVRDGEIIGRGFHLRAGEGHAEVNAIADAGGAGAVKGATAYVTLEPCSHTGRTAPCCEALIAAGIRRVVVAMEDPNPLVAGQGIARLQQTGISVETGLLEAEARALNPGFIKRMETGLPWVRVKLAMSVDGRTAMASGESQWITGPAARGDVQCLRARSCAIISGVETVILDNAALTVRPAEMPEKERQSIMAAGVRQPLRVVLDSAMRLSASAKIFSESGDVWIVAAKENLRVQAELERAGAKVLVLPNSEGRVDLTLLLAKLSEAGCNEVMVEAGATLAGAFAQAGLVDEYHIYMAPVLMGSEGRPLLHWPLELMAERQHLHIDNISKVGDDWRIDARPAKSPI